MPYLLQIHIGPVQAFIAAARRTRDLWFGSWVLSERSKAAAKAIADEEGLNALIFPAPENEGDLAPNSDLSVSNKVVAVIEQPQDKVTEIAERAKQAVKARLEQIFETSLRPDTRNALQPSWTEITKQLDDLDEFYWVAVPYADGGYKDAREKADRLLAARKNTRTFRKVTWGSNLPKSSLDGTRESVIPPTHLGDEKKMYDLYRAKRSEELSGVDLLKRLGKKEGQARFPSTSHMAAWPLAHQLDTTKGVKSAWKKYIKVLEGISKNMVQEERCFLKSLQLPNLGDADGSLLYESRLLDYLSGSDLKRAKSALTEFFSQTNISKPFTYYALLVGDGDFMGKSIDRLQKVAENRKFTQKLSKFASEAQRLVRQHEGEAIYTGGDDVLALLPVHKAVLCAYELSVTFARQMKEYPRDDGNTPTFSAGIAIVHHLEPLEDALKLASDAEKEAKGVDGKNALAVSLDKRSGVVRTVKGKWRDEGEMAGLNGRLHTFAQYHIKDYIPDRMAYQIQETIELLGGRKEVQADPELVNIVKKEAFRIMKRKFKSVYITKRKEDDDQEKKKLEKIENGFTKLIDVASTNVVDLVNELIIAKAIAEAMKLEKEPKKKEIA